MRKRSLALSVTALALLSPLAAGCSGDDGDDKTSGDESTSEVSSGSGETAGPKEPSTMPPTCPFTQEQLDEALGVKLKQVKNADCAFEARKGQGRISVTRDAAADNKSFEDDAETVQDWDHFEELDDVDGRAFVAWSDDDLNLTIGYLDNAGAYRYQVSAVTPDEAGADDAVDLAEKLIELTVTSRKG